MRRAFTAVVLVAFLVLAAGALRAHAQSPAPSTSESASDDGDGTGRPWGRLAIFVPVSVALGAGAVYGRRLARERGWLGS